MITSMLAILALNSIAETETLNSVHFEDVTDTVLPVGHVDGLSMDAHVFDPDQDGDLDVMLAMEYRPNILLMNDGTGQFTDVSHSHLPARTHDSEDIASGDFDGDGDIDAISVTEDDQTNEFYRNTGNGVFEAAPEMMPGTYTTNGVASADLNADGLPDLVLANIGQNRIWIASPEGFQDETETRLPTVEDASQDAEFGDVDGDGDLDLIFGNEDRNRLLLNDGTGRFTDGGSLEFDETRTSEVTREADFGDVDGDGDLDLVFANYAAAGQPPQPKDRLLINDGAGHFTDETASRLPDRTDFSLDADFVDLDQDGDLDLLMSTVPSSPEGSRWLAFRNDGTGHFTDETDLILPQSAVGAGLDSEAGDLNGDGILDLYLAARPGRDRILFGKAG